MFTVWLASIFEAMPTHHRVKMSVVDTENSACLYFLALSALVWVFPKLDSEARSWVQVVYLGGDPGSIVRGGDTGKGGKPVNNVLMSWLLLWEPGVISADRLYGAYLRNVSEGGAETRVCVPLLGISLGPSTSLGFQSAPCRWSAYSHSQMLAWGRPREPSGWGTVCRWPLWKD